MRRPLVYLCAWAMAASVIVGVSWLGINNALGTAMFGEGKALSAADLRDAAPPSPSPSPIPSPSPSPSPKPSPSSTAPSPKPSPTPSEAWVPQANEEGIVGYRRGFHIQGGDVVVWVAKGNVQIVESNPKSGWVGVVESREKDTASVIFYFMGRKDRKSYVFVKWVDKLSVEFGESIGLERSA